MGDIRNEKYKINYFIAIKVLGCYLCASASMHVTDGFSSYTLKKTDIKPHL